jgi:hypothetical protein
MKLKAMIAIAAVGLCLAFGMRHASAASVTLDKFGGLTLVLPDDRWPDARTEEGPPEAEGAPWTRVIIDDREGHSSVVVFATSSDGNRFTTIEDWISKQEIHLFLTWSVGKYDSGDFQRNGSDSSSVRLVHDVSATLAKEDLTINGNGRRAWMLYFADPENRYWYWIGFYSNGVLADHNEALDHVRSGLAWAGRAEQ